MDRDLQAILQRLPSPLTLAAMDQPDSPIIAANAAFLGMCGYPLEQVLGRNCRFLQSGQENVPARAEIRSALADGRRTQVILRNARADGAEFWNHLTIVPVAVGIRGQPDLFLGAQFMMTENEVKSLRQPGIAAGEAELSGSLGRHRNLMLERRRMSIEAAIRLVESSLLLSTLRNRS